MKNYTRDIIEKLIIQKGKCFYCGFPMPLITKNPFLKITRDHFQPKSHGGGNKKNIVLCHYVCNQQKNDNDPTGAQIFQFNQFRHKLKQNRSELRNLFIYYNRFKRFSSKVQKD